MNTPRLYILDYAAEGARWIVLRAYDLNEALKQYDVLFTAGFVPGLPDPLAVPDDYRGVTSIEPHPPYRERYAYTMAAGRGEGDAPTWGDAMAAMRESHGGLHADEGNWPPDAPPDTVQRYVSAEELGRKKAPKPEGADVLNDEEAEPS